MIYRQLIGQDGVHKSARRDHGRPENIKSIFMDLLKPESVDQHSKMSATCLYSCCVCFPNTAWVTKALENFR